MNYSKDNLKKEIKKTKTSAGKNGSKGLILILEAAIVVLLTAVVVGASLAIGAAKGVVDTAPDVTVEDITPKGLPSSIYDSDGNLIQSLVGSGANRELVEYEELPADLINAFVAIEDERYWQHEGIDPKGIVRAAFVGVLNGFNFTEGASTITQQLIKNNVFAGGSEKTTGARFVRKIQEQFIATKLEQNVSKKEIIKNYLNSINLGANCLGVAKAASRYFGKTVSELTLSECAVIAAITQNPYAYNPIRFPEKNAIRREKVLNNMETNGYISAEQKAEALGDNVYDRIAEYNLKYQSEDTVYSYFVDRLINDVSKDLQTKAGYSEEQARQMLYSGGLKIYTTQDSSIQAIVDKEVNDPANYEGIKQKYSFTYTLRLVHNDGTYNDYNEKDIKQSKKLTFLDFDTKEEIQALIDEFKAAKMVGTDEITIERLDISLQPQLSVVVMDQSTGYVKALAGGRGEKTASLSLNRATNTMRQPGSTFKVLASFAPALEYDGATLATTYYDEPFSTGADGQYWSPKNWYSSNTFLGYANIHQGITYSMNIVAAKNIVELVGSRQAFDMVEDFGINTLIEQTAENKITGKNDLYPTLALGGITQGVTNLQLTAAYATIANSGTYIKPVLYTSVTDERGNVIIENVPETHPVISEETAFLLTTAMASSLEDTKLNGLIDSSSPDAKPEKLIAAAGKSGTTNSYNDLWFEGYTPYYTMGIWSGFDDNDKFEGSDNRSFHKIIWRKIMDQITADLPYAKFEMPEDIVKVEICTKSGMLATDACKADPRNCIVGEEYFVLGTEPKEPCTLHQSVQLCADSGLLATINCKNIKPVSYMNLPVELTSVTDDSNYTLDKLPTQICDKCLPVTPVDPLNPTPDANKQTGPAVTP